ncbi:MAG: hypothetical protein IJP54_06295 [Synergistaceae bacterium]|nr:hypothetical protein [Synergistaceae bacterium]
MEVIEGADMLFGEGVDADGVFEESFVPLLDFVLKACPIFGNFFSGSGGAVGVLR